MNEETKKQIIKDVGTFKVVDEILTDSRVIDAADKADVPWTAKQVTNYDLNK